MKLPDPALLDRFRGMSLWCRNALLHHQFSALWALGAWEEAVVLMEAGLSQEERAARDAHLAKHDVREAAARVDTNPLTAPVCFTLTGWRQEVASA